MLVSETKLADFFPMAQILLDVFFKLHRLGRFSNGRGILYVKDDISSCLPTDHRLPEIEIEIEIILFKSKIQKFTVKTHQSISDQNISKYIQSIVHDNSQFRNLHTHIKKPKAKMTAS